MKLRRFFQVGATLGVNSHLSGFTQKSIYQGPLKAFCVPVLNCTSCPSALYSCPIGTIQHFMAVRAFPYFIFGILGMIGAAVGAMPCGMLCPFGLVQDLLYKVPFFKIRIPRILSYFRFLVLGVGVIAIPWITSLDWFCLPCPVSGLMTTIPWLAISTEIRSMAIGVIWIKASFLLFFLFLSILAKRPFCQTSCPLGSIFGFFNRISFVRLNWDSSKCAHCNKCLEICPMEVTVNEDPNTTKCIRCLDCTGCEAISVVTPFHRSQVESEGTVESLAQ